MIVADTLRMSSATSDKSRSPNGIGMMRWFGTKLIANVKANVKATFFLMDCTSSKAMV
ncbi:hypothetical protein Pla52o_15500 [Novipirellula galeiformis]|uniref:Uncharacterized protein n=1 Tax=Novipirellula galeiformis TaxID=2528004 RepID=A0A5C6CLN4_9BACT|nr:hypothetical protein [Novipirellula galeiformis]TWU25252.1 hypothetical protein Pla52o_15500 [Novipirellula galeiformis]